MAAYKAGWNAAVGALRVIGAALAGLFAAVFGSVDWYAPDWLRLLGRRLRNGWQRLREHRRAHPARTAGIAALAAIAAIGAVALWQWHERQPKPQVVAYTVEAPARTCYECDPPGAPEPLRVRFAASVAPLEAAGKPLADAASRLELVPAHPGQWHWEDDKTLRFDPAEDWPVGQRFAVDFKRSGLIAAHLRLNEYGFAFSAPAFEAQVRDTEFYQDPQVVTDKKAVLTVGFSHPVDRAAFEERIGLTLFDRVADDRETELGAVAYRVTYDALGLEAYVSSNALSVPAKQGRLEFRIGKGLRAARGGNQTTEALQAEVGVPGRDALAVQTLRLDLARDDNQDPQQVAILEFGFPVSEKTLPSKLKGWLLPTEHPDAGLQADFAQSHPGQPYDWTRGVDNRVLQRAATLELEAVPGEREQRELHSYRHAAAPGRYVYLRVDQGLESFGGYRLAQTQERVLRVPDYPRELRIVAPGSLLAMSGARQLDVLTRDLPAMRIEVSRLLPRQLQHLVSQTRGDFSTPQFHNWALNQDNLSERFSRVERLQTLAPGQPAYTALDLAPYLKADDPQDRRGVFLLKLQGWDTDSEQPIHGPQLDQWGERFEGPVTDARLIVVTDLGLLVKRNLDGSQDLFVQSIHDGLPVADVRVEVIGRNGLPVLSRSSDAQGHVHFPGLKDFQREQEPVLYLARKGGDTSFLPIDWRMRPLDLSRFDVGGAANVADAGALSAYLFSDRGVYRPGEEIRLGAIVRTQNWQALPQGLPLLLEVTDPRGQTVRRERLPLSAVGFEDIRHLTGAASPTGTWTFALSIVRDRYRNDLVGSTTVLVRDFEPDRMKMTARLSAQRAQGWVSPDKLSASVDLQNLFGAPAQNRRVTASLRLSPSLPRFDEYPAYQFSDPHAAREGYSEDLAETTTDAQGMAQLDLRLNRFAKATYRLQLVTQGFEAQGGRGVAAQVTQLVSSMPFLVGVKADGDLAYVSRDAERTVELIAVDPALEKTAAAGLRLRRLEIVHVSTLVKQNNGTYKYESRRRENLLSEADFAIAAAGERLRLDSSSPGSFAYVLVDAQDQSLARVDYTVAGDANLSARLEKNAELQIALSKKDYSPGEEIELQINAPYTGAGLITIERDKVYAWQWFRSDTTASTQRIRLPEGIEGNAYVSVSFVRDPASPEIYTRPLSYGVAPFSVHLDARRSRVEVQLPARVKPGETAHFRYRTDRPSKLLLFAVDEGILQVARYTTPDPIGFLFQKKSLDVGTIQILDLILPEFRRALMQAAPGGDADGLLAKHLNPFKRRGDPPVAYWSGIVDADRTERSLEYTVPDHFNGRLRVMAVAVADSAVGVFEGATTVRGDFVLTPNAPAFVAPGDTFEVSLGVSNQAEGSGAAAEVELALSATGGLEVLGHARHTLAVAEGAESSLRFQLKATADLGDARLRFTATQGPHSARREIGLSVRPAVPYRSTLDAALIAPGKSVDRALARTLFPQFREQQAGISALPLGLAQGFVAYLDHYPYACTEQLVSQAMPALVLSRRPEFGRVQGDTQAGGIDELIAELRARQNPDGAYRYWPGGFETREFVSVYTQHVLIEAQDRAIAVPRDLLEQGNEYLRQLAARDADNLQGERNSAYALYLLTRQGHALGAQASRLRQRLETRYPEQWRGDIASAYLAAALKLMQQQQEADALFAKLDWRAERPTDGWFDAMTADASLLYLAARHFPASLTKLPADFVQRMADRIAQKRYHSLSAASTLLALDAYAEVAGPQAGDALSIAALAADGSATELKLPDGLFRRTDIEPEVSGLRFDNRGSLPAYAVIAQSGFDRDADQGVLREGFEILREYTDAQGAPLGTVTQGQEIVARLKFRAVDGGHSSNVALVDLLPGGFEPVVPTTAADTRIGAASADDASATADGDGGNGWTCAICQPGTRAGLAYADFREDRNVFYVTVTPEMSEIVYRLKATNIGTYTLPPAYGEGLYDRGFNARSGIGRITVISP